MKENVQYSPPAGGNARRPSADCDSRSATNAKRIDGIVGLRIALVVILLLVGSEPCRAATWVRIGLTSNRLVWGIQGGVQFAIPPDEITLTVRSEPDSNPMAFCVLTATMGNLIRARRLWLKGEVINSWDIYGEYQGNDFAPHTFVPFNRLARLPSGDVVVAITTNEPNPASIFPYPGTRRWHYGGASVTQYWRAHAHSSDNRLEAVVNARRVYWKSEHVIPGGVAYENFELREPFHNGQQFIFGITRKTPEEMGIVGR